MMSRSLRISDVSEVSLKLTKTPNQLNNSFITQNIPMKHLQNYTLIVLLAFVAFFVSSCNTDDAPPMLEPDLSVVNEELAINGMLEDLNNVTLNVLGSGGLAARTNVVLPSSKLCPGAKVTMDKSNKEITVDFGDGCTSENGTLRKGKIMISYNGNLLFPTAKITTSFENYEVNGYKIEGVRSMINKSFDLATNSIDLEVSTQNAKVTWPDNTFVTFSSNQTQNIQLSPEGYQTSTTGTVSGVSREGFNYTAIVTDSIVVTENCIESGITAPSSGMVSFKYNNTETTVDYGDGSCDNLVTVKYPGGSKEISID